MADLDSTGIIAQLIEGLDAGALITRFVLVAEVIDSDGERVLWTDTHDGATRWDIYGLLTWALNEEQTSQLASGLPTDEDDE